MAELQVRILGVTEAQAYLDQLNRSARQVGDQTVYVGTPLVYGWGMEFGRYRNGRLARRAGGAFYLTGGLEAALPSIAPALVAAMQRGPSAVRQAAVKIGHDVERVAKGRAPVLTGALRNSIQTVLTGG